MKMQKYFLLIFIIFLGVYQPYQHALADNYGYIQDISSEKNDSYHEIVIFPPQDSNKSGQNQTLFIPELSKEFKTKYIQKFGTVDTDSFVYRDPQYAEMDDDNRRGYVTEQANITARQDFAEFMVKRLTEWHVDHFIKDNPQMRPVYEAKEKISNVKVTINKETKLDIQYSLSGNTLDLNFINPVLDSRIISYMDPSAFGPASAIENKIWLGKQINPRSRINIIAAEMDGIVTGEYVHKFDVNMTTTVASSTWFKDGGTSPRETKTTINMSRSF
jgi:hypothetical protein